MDIGRTTDVVYLDFSKSFDTVPHNILLSKLGRSRFDRRTLWWMRNWLDGCIQRVTVNGSMAGWTSVTSGVPQGSILGPVLFSIFINDVDSEIECILSKFADDTKLSDTIDTPVGQDAIQGHLDKLEKGTHLNLMTCNKAKRKVLHMGRGNPWYQHRLEDEGVERSPAKRDLGVLAPAWGLPRAAGEYLPYRGPPQAAGAQPASPWSAPCAAWGEHIFPLLLH